MMLTVPLSAHSLQRVKRNHEAGSISLLGSLIGLALNKSFATPAHRIKTTWIYGSFTLWYDIK